MKRKLARGSSSLLVHKLDGPSIKVGEMPMATILPNNLQRQYQLHADEYKCRACQVLDSGWYVLGNEVQSFEKSWSEYIGVPYCAGVASGLDALTIAFRVLGVGVGDEVIVASNAYIACVMGITINGAVPVFVEPNDYLNIDESKIEAAITAKTKAILAVHLFGQCCDMDTICSLADKHGLYVVEDCAQAHGNHWNGNVAGSFGILSCFSFYPTKGCGAFGDGGAVCTTVKEYDERVRAIRNYGSHQRYVNTEVGMNSRLDELQAGLLNVKLGHLQELNDERVSLAERYMRDIENPFVRLPQVRLHADSVWHQYVIRTEHRDALIDHLNSQGIGSIIHYPIPPHLQPAYAYLGYKRGDFPIAERQADEVLSLPMYNGMTDEEQARVIEAINSFNWLAG